MSQIQHLNPDALVKNPAFTSVVIVPANAKTIYIGGIDATTAAGEIVGKGDVAAQADQVFKNLIVALDAAGARLENVIKWNIYIVQGQSLYAGFQAFQRVWGNRPNPPAITTLFVTGLAHPDFLVEMDAVAVIE